VSPASPASGVTYYRLAAPLVVRFFGAAVIALAVLVFIATAVIGLAGIDVDWLVLVLALGVVAVLVLGWWLRNRAYVVRCSPAGYSVRLVRGAGVREARWTDVAQAVASKPHGTPCLVLKLKDGRTTTIPVTILAIDREQFVREMQRHLGTGQGVRRL
jgi:hypothetical protein